MSENNIYELLPKHFSKETSEEEEKIVLDFKQKHSSEYDALARVWESQERIEVLEFDTHKAWEKITSKSQSKQSKVLPLFSKIKWVAAVLLLGFLGKYAFDFFQEKEVTNNIAYVSKTNTSDQALEIVLHDGSVVWLNQHSTLSYPEKFKKHIRNVRLSGEAFFDVAKNPGSPFIISTEHSDITVVGTSFNIVSDSTQTEISVRTGKVKVQSAYNNEKVLLAANQGSIISPSELVAFDIENENYLAWKTGSFVFNETPIDKVVKDLNTYYEPQIVLNNPKTQCLLTTNLNQMPLKDVMEILKLSCDLKIKNTDDYYEIY